MIQIFCSERGAGKTKVLIERANEFVQEAKGDILFIDDDRTNVRLINRKIRFVAAEDFSIEGCKCFYGFLCGIISNNYDIERIYIDGLLSVVKCQLQETKELFFKLAGICDEYKINMFININSEKLEDVPSFIREYVG